MEKIVCPYCGKKFAYDRAKAKEAIGYAGESQDTDDEIRALLLELKQQLTREQEYISRRLVELEYKKAAKAAALAGIEEAEKQVDMNYREQAKELLRSYGWDLD